MVSIILCTSSSIGLLDLNIMSMSWVLLLSIFLPMYKCSLSSPLNPTALISLKFILKCSLPDPYPLKIKLCTSQSILRMFSESNTLMSGLKCFDIKSSMTVFSFLKEYIVFGLNISNKSSN